MRVLLTGFDPFGGSTINPSAEASQLLRGRPIPGIELITHQLPVVGGAATAQVIAAIDSSRPDSLVLLGESGQAAAITIERLAANLRDYRIADNAGGQVTDQPVVPGGPAAYFATLPVKAMQSAIQEEGIPADLSMSAGTFLCNEVMYAALHHIAVSGLPIRAGFIHLPQLPEQVVSAGRGRASMDRETIVRGVAAALRTLRPVNA
jgi:pyroglutamyl-peptidase